MIFPRLVYKSTSTYLLVETKEQYDAAISGDWFDCIPDAIAGKKQVDNTPPTREEMEIKAKELQLKFDGRTTDAKLCKMIEEALK